MTTKLSLRLKLTDFINTELEPKIMNKIDIVIDVVIDMIDMIDMIVGESINHQIIKAE